MILFLILHSGFGISGTGTVSVCFKNSVFVLLTDNICLASKDGVLKFIRNYRELIIRCPVHSDGVVGCRAKLLSDTWRTRCCNNNDDEKKINNEDIVLIRHVLSLQGEKQHKIKYAFFCEKKEGIWTKQMILGLFWPDCDKLKLLAILNMKQKCDFISIEGMKLIIPPLTLGFTQKNL